MYPGDPAGPRGAHFWAEPRVLESNQQSAWAQEQQLIARTKTQISSSLRSASYYHHPKVVVAAWAARPYGRPHTPPQTKTGNTRALRLSQSA